MSNYPEHYKLTQVKEQTQAIGEFLDWLDSEKSIQLGAFDDRTEQMYPFQGSWLDLLAEWAGIDRGRLAAEKEQMIADLRAMNGG